MALLSNTIIFGVLFFILILGYYIFYANPYHVVDLFKIPLIVIYVFTIFCAIIFMERQLKSTTVQVADLFTDFTFYFIKYSKFILILVAVAIGTYFIYRGFIHASVFLLDYSLWYTLGLLIIVLALLNKYSGEDGTFDNPVLQIVKDVIMYIPCLLTDFIEYVKKDYNDTPTTTFILSVILFIYILFVYLIPEVSKEMYKNDGILLIDKPVYLNTNIISLSRTELNAKILKSLPFYDRWVHKLLLRLESFKLPEKNDVSGNLIDLSGSLMDLSGNFNYLKSKYGSIESFTSVMNEDTKTVNGWFSYLKMSEQAILNKLFEEDPSIQKDMDQLAFLWDNRPELLRAYISYLVLKHPTLLSFVEKIEILYSATSAIGYTALSVPSIVFGQSITTGNLYHYSLSFWVFFNTVECTKKQTIMTFGLKPSLYYNPEKGELIVEVKDKNATRNKFNRPTTIYKTNNILFQRWNHIVMNYNYGTFDMFINNNLVTTTNFVPYMSPQEMLIVGSSDNDNVGGICNMKYYNIPLSASKINSIYKTFHSKSTPI
jgi:hypothetical protein